MDRKAAILQQIDTALKRADQLRKSAQLGDLSDVDGVAAAEILTRMQAIIERVAPPRSAYRRRAEAFVDLQDQRNIHALAGVLSALRTDYAAGYLETIHELLHAELFSDFLEMADHLLSEGYKDAAAVIAGSVLEEHLRKLAEKHGIPVAKAEGRPKKADLLNAELRGEDAYQTLDQKSVTAWLDLRNNAAHGKYEMYVREQVVMMVQGVRDFMVRLPA